MSILVGLHHLTHYKYDRPVSLGMQTVRLRPAPHTRSPVQSYSLQIRPEEHFINWQQDPFGNFLGKVVFPKQVCEFRIEVDLVTEIRAFNPFDFFLEEGFEQFPFEYEEGLKKELAPYLEIKEQGSSLKKLLASLDRSKRSVVDYLVDLNQIIQQRLSYMVRMEAGVQSCEETLQLGHGSCRDMAWLLSQVLRHQGLASRFASGYLIQLAADVKSLDGPSGAEHDFTDLHAWTEVYLPGAGWVGLDPTSGLFAGEGHIPLCCTPNPSSAAPVTGTLGECEATLNHEMSVTRLKEAPRVTKPFAANEWAAIDRLGEEVERKLEQAEVKLTMGGEPTFVSIDERQHNAWHFEALGANKRERGREMMSRLKQRFAPGGLTMHTQGKWYPGEILPRWSLDCFWRTDGEAVWENEALLAEPDESLSHTLTTAQEFLGAIAAELAIPEDYVLEAREDTPFYLWKERRLPVENEIMAADVFEKRERERLQQLLDKDLNQTSGFVLPLSFSPTRKRWISNRWQFRSGHLVLLTGDSPVGLRLPLGSLPFPEEAEEEVHPERDPFSVQGALPTRNSLCQKTREAANDSSFQDDPNGLIHTALCAETRSGVLHLFLPPLARIEYFLELIAAIESVAEGTKTPLVLEGYTPPRDPRVKHFSVTPDPGVLEVNVQPAKDWDELKRITQTVYEEARLARLSTEKFLIDGRRAGTGGGNHIVLGASNPSDSPFLRRPDVLRSLVCFWQNHPALSYLFSGQYIGPTSQAPRIDEARHESLYELEIAFQQVPEKEEVSPWLVDRLFRNLLVDLTGNTHRAEFCIDKLYSPDSSRGRLGLLEMRGFEMSPHPQLALLQALLLRACIACFWERPYEGKLIRWGTQLHDKFMLPHYVWEDFKEALDTLKRYGVEFAPEWFQPFLYFRFPECGKHQVGEIELTLRNALEPWPVLGEELVAGSVSRAVDASVERVELTARGLRKGKHLVVCNGRAVPLSPTGEQGKSVAGIRFKAWPQPSSLHPNLPLQSPLVFDIVDVMHERSIGGFRYYAAHPGGRNFETFPVNEQEAEGRRLARFQAMGHSAGTVEPMPVKVNEEFPHTLDLRFQ